MMEKEFYTTKLCWNFLHMTDEQQNETLALFNEEQKEAFLRMVTCFRVLVDEKYRAKIKSEVLRMYLEEIL